MLDRTRDRLQGMLLGAIALRRVAACCWARQGHRFPLCCVRHTGEKVDACDLFQFCNRHNGVVVDGFVVSHVGRASPCPCVNNDLEDARWDQYTPIQLANGAARKQGAGDCVNVSALLRETPHALLEISPEVSVEDGVLSDHVPEAEGFELRRMGGHIAAGREMKYPVRIHT